MKQKLRLRDSYALLITNQRNQSTAKLPSQTGGNSGREGHQPQRRISAKGNEESCVCTHAKAPARSGLGLALGLMVVLLCTNMCLYTYGQPEGITVPLGISLDSIKPLQIDDAIPEALWHLPLQVVNHPPTGGRDTITLNDYRGKLIILDFWATWCVPCISSLQELDTLQKQFTVDLAVIPTTYEETNKASEFFTARGWSLPTAAAETTLKKYFPYQSIPHQVWIKDGRVKAIVGSEYANAKNIRRVMEGQHVVFNNKVEVPLDKTKPLFLNGNGGDGSELQFYSTISSRIRPRVAGGGVDVHAEGNKALFINMSPDNLFRYAFEEDIGLDKRRVIWETSDSLYRQIKGKDIAKPTGDYTKDKAFYDWASRNTFCYNLFSKMEMEAAAIRTTMKKDLNQYFGSYYGINAVLQRRKIPCLVVRKVHEDTARLESKGGPQVIALESADGYRCANAPFTPMIRAILGRVEPGAFLVDSTYYNGMVDLNIPRSIDGNFTKAQKELARYGLKLFREEIEMDMLVIKEKF